MRLYEIQKLILISASTLTMSKSQSGWSVFWHRESRPWGSGLQAMRVRSTRLAWGVAFWRQKAPE